MLDVPILAHKADLIRLATEIYDISSVVDVGGCWGVHGGYAFHALEQPSVTSATIIDGYVTPPTRERAARFENVRFLEGDLGSVNVINKLPHSSMAIIFDILLHQVSPDWDEILELYASKVDHFCIYNQNWEGSETFRFIDKGLDWYIDNVTFNDNAQEITEWFENHDQHHPGYNRLWRDVFFHWQWGIVSVDIIKKMADLGFELDYFWNHGLLSQGKIRDQGYLFSRQGRYTHARHPLGLSVDRRPEGEMSVR